MTWSIRSKLLAITGVTTAATLLLGLTVVIVSDIRAYRADLVANTRLVAQVVAVSVQNALTVGDRERAAAALAELAQVPTIEVAWLLDANGAIIAHHGSGTAALPDDLSRPVVLRADGRVVVVAPVTDRGRRLGTLVLGASTAEVDVRIARRAGTLLALLTAMVAAATAITYRLQRLISQPILDLAATARRITATGNHAIRVRRSGDDEIGELCDSFNRMLDQIQLGQLERDEAVHRTREKSHFLAAMSHELRTPLNAIIGFSEILLARSKDQLDHRLRRFLTNIHSSGQHLLGIINDILDLAKIEAGQMELVLEPVAIQALLEGVVAVMKGTSAKKQIEIRIEGTSDLPTVEADAIKLKQVFFNLLANAVKFSPPTSVVRVSARALAPTDSALGAPSVEVAFIDHGIGIDATDFEKIFQPFRQADSGIARQFGGTGLGLALVRSYVHKHHGRILLESAIGEGSTFTVILPVCQRPRAAAALVDTADTALPSKRVVVVEDDPAALGRVRGELVQHGFEVVPASTSEEAIELIRKVAPAAVILDLGLPDPRGWALLCDIKLNRATAGIPVVLCCGLKSAGQLVALGADDYFLGPMALEKIVVAVRRLLGADAGTGARTMIVSDEPALVEQLEARLVGEGVRSVAVSSCRKALAAASELAPRLIILDLMTERMRGFRAALELRAASATRDVPIILLNASQPSADDLQLLHDSILDLTDHSQPRPLLVVVQSLLTRRLHQRRRG